MREDWFEPEGGGGRGSEFPVQQCGKGLQGFSDRGTRSYMIVLTWPLDSVARYPSQGTPR